MSQTMRLTGYTVDGQLVKDVQGTFDEAPEFYAHQLLHVDGIVAVEILVPDGDQPSGSRSVLRRTDPGLVFEDVVKP